MVGIDQNHVVVGPTVGRDPQRRTSLQVERPAIIGLDETLKLPWRHASDIVHLDCRRYRRQPLPGPAESRRPLSDSGSCRAMT